MSSTSTSPTGSARSELPSLPPSLPPLPPLPPHSPTSAGSSEPTSATPRRAASRSIARQKREQRPFCFFRKKVKKSDLSSASRALVTLTMATSRTILISVDDSVEAEKALIWTLDNFYKCVFAFFSLSSTRSLCGWGWVERKEEAREQKERRDLRNFFSLTMPFFSTSIPLVSLLFLSFLSLSLQAWRPHPPHPRHPAPAARRGLRGAAGRLSAAAGEETEGGFSFVSLRPSPLAALSLKTPPSLSFPSLSSRFSNKKNTSGPRRLRAAHQERRALCLPALPPAPPRDQARPGGPPGQGRGRRRLDRQRRLPQGRGPRRRGARDGVAHKVEAAGVFPRERDELLLPPLRVPRARCQVKGYKDGVLH